MKASRISVLLVVVLLFIFPHFVSAQEVSDKIKILVVSSYHREYLWSQDTHAGVCAAFKDFHFLDENEVDEFTKNDYVQGKKAIVKKEWMDTKRKNSREEIVKTIVRIVDTVNEFSPDIILLGDDNAANYIGNQFIDTDIPVVFWGINGYPLKYGLAESIQQPGHNITGVYQAGYLAENIKYLKELVPAIETLAVLSDDSETGRSKVKGLQALALKGELPVEIVSSIITDSFSEWKTKALEMQEQVDAFFVLNHNTLKDDLGNTVDQMEAGAWYLHNIKKPDCAQEKQFSTEGILLVVDDSGFNQGYEAVRMANQILIEGLDPAGIPLKAPNRGAVMVNSSRAKALGVDLSDKDFIEETIDGMLALEKFPQEAKVNAIIEENR